MPRPFIAVVHAAAASLALAGAAFAQAAQVGQQPHNVQNVLSITLPGSEADLTGIHTCSEDPTVRVIPIKPSRDHCVCVTSPCPCDD